MTVSTSLQAACLARIDTTALRHNYTLLKQKAQGAKVLVLLKANAYGHGLLTVAHALPDADAFGVARLDEAMRLREAGISNRIVVLGGVQQPAEWQVLDRLQLDVVIHQREQLQACEAFCSELTVRQQCGFNVWLKFDTGMHRLGFSLKELASVKNALDKLAVHFTRPPVVMSHFANSDDQNDPLNRTQERAFNSIRDTFESNNDRAYEFSLANSGALLSQHTPYLDWVRPGIALFGIAPFEDKTGADFGLKPVMSLESRLIAIKQVEAGEGVGYGHAWTATTPTRIGIASIGYGDGYPWQADNGTPVRVEGQTCQLVGRVSMDMIAIDLSQSPKAIIGSGVQLWGDQLPVETIATHAKTIAYTLVCGITERVAVDVF